MRTFYIDYSSSDEESSYSQYDPSSLSSSSTEWSVSDDSSDEDSVEFVGTGNYQPHMYGLRESAAHREVMLAAPELPVPVKHAMLDSDFNQCVDINYEDYEFFEIFENIKEHVQSNGALTIEDLVAAAEVEPLVNDNNKRMVYTEEKNHKKRKFDIDTRTHRPLDAALLRFI